MYNYSLKVVEYKDNDEYGTHKNPGPSILASTFMKTDDVNKPNELHLISFNQDELDLVYKQECNDENVEEESSIMLKLSAEDSLGSSQRPNQMIPAEFSENIDRLNSLVETAVINYSLTFDDTSINDSPDPSFSLRANTQTLNDSQGKIIIKFLP